MVVVAEDDGAEPAEDIVDVEPIGPRVTSAPKDGGGGIDEECSDDDDVETERCSTSFLFLELSCIPVRKHHHLDTFRFFFLSFFFWEVLIPLGSGGKCT